MPEDPVGTPAQLAIEFHAMLELYEAAGFSRKEAFRLVEAQVDSYWGAAYTRSILYGGRSLPDG